MSVSTADDLDPVDEPRLVGGAARHDDRADPTPCQRRHHRQHARDRADLAAERELADHRQSTRAGPDLLGAEQDPDRHREVERGAGLAQLRRREVDGDPPRWMDEPGIAERTADPLPCLLERRVGETHDREARQPGRDVHFDADEPALEAEQRGGRDDGQHAATLSRGGHLRLTSGSPAAHRRLTAADGRVTPGQRAVTAFAVGGGRDRLVDGPREVQRAIRRAPSRPS